jgi:RNA polymerase sigma-54 factor
MNLGFDMNLSMQQKLSFQMIQSLKLLQATTLQLEQQIQTELAMNPLLETTESQELEYQDEDDVKNDDEGELDVEEDAISVDDYLEDGFEYSYDTGVSASDSQEKQDYVESLQVYEETLEEILTKQLHELGLHNEELELVINFLIASVDERGYLPDMDLEELTEILGVSEDNLQQGIITLQSFEPAGVGARTLRECLMLQLAREGREASLAYAILDEKWKLFEKLKIPALARSFEVDQVDIQNSIDEIRELDPKPAKLYCNTSETVAVPDLVVEEIDGELTAIINDRFLPDLRINKAYSDMLKRKSGAGKDVKEFLREKQNGANWLIRAIEQRRTTMLRVMDAIMKKQETFFKEGPPNLNPLKLQDIADIVEMHVSTISRVTNNKFVQTPYGLFELKYFFSEALGQTEDGDDISTTKIKNRLNEMIGDEDKSSPLSDQKLSEMMTEVGFKLARRTVAKYREQLGLATARMRKVYE